ncbi:MAG TPA: alpha/beta hydrolase [Euzebya sp.]|nr:alpha/beta hydrolase [Euzebya sp.]
MTALDSHTHVHVPADPGVATTLVLLHGTGGDERQLLDLGRLIAPGAGLLGVRGNVREAGRVTRWFRRFGEGTFDTADVIARSDDLAGFFTAAIEAYDLDPDGLVGVGFSNGANMAAATMLQHPGVLRGGVLFSAMLPLRPQPLPDLSTAAVLMVQGRVDPYAPADQAEALAVLLADAGASVEVAWHDEGHATGATQAAEAKRWLTAFRVGTGASPGATPS